MGSDHGIQAARELKQNLHLKAKKTDTASLKALSQKLKMPQRTALEKKYGKVLRLMDVEVQVDAITALAQFYDQPLRCFTFQDFQLAPTLEEYEQILGLPIADQRPYRYLGHYAALETVAKVLKIHPKDLQAAQQNRNEIKGFPREFLDKHMKLLAQAENWDAFIDALALTLYGLILFPNLDNYVDFAAIDVFLAWNSDQKILSQQSWQMSMAP